MFKDSNLSLEDYLNECKTNNVQIDLSDCDLRGYKLDEMDWRGANLTDACLQSIILTNSNLTGANLTGADLKTARLDTIILAKANLTNADLSGATLIDVVLTDTCGLGTKEGEIAFAKQLYEDLKNNLWALDMMKWHGKYYDPETNFCGTRHCIAGHYDNNCIDGRKASTKIPTLAQYFFGSNREAYEAIIRVAEGTESVFN